jgi:hypothetical protein
MAPPVFLALSINAFTAGESGLAGAASGAWACRSATDSAQHGRMQWIVADRFDMGLDFKLIASMCQSIYEPLSLINAPLQMCSDKS